MHWVFEPEKVNHACIIYTAGSVLITKTNFNYESNRRILFREERVIQRVS